MLLVGSGQEVDMTMITERGSRAEARQRDSASADRSSHAGQDVAGDQQRTTPTEGRDPLGSEPRLQAAGTCPPDGGASAPAPAKSHTVADGGASAPASSGSHTVADGITVRVPVSETADHGHWTTRQDQYWTDAAAFMVTVLVLDSTKARPVKVQIHGASLSCLLDLPRVQARRLGLALLAAANYDTPGGAS
jgi:hypothetical protein